MLAYRPLRLDVKKRALRAEPEPGSSRDLTDNGSKLNIGQRVYRITSPSAFTVAPSVPRKKGGK